MTDSRLVASIKTNKPVVVEAQILLNSLIAVNEIEGSATLDLFFKLKWIDPRWAIPDMWKLLDATIAVQSITFFCSHFSCW